MRVLIVIGVVALFCMAPDCGDAPSIRERRLERDIESLQDEARERERELAETEQDLTETEKDLAETRSDLSRAREEASSAHARAEETSQAFTRERAERGGAEWQAREASGDAWSAVFLALFFCVLLVLMAAGLARSIRSRRALVRLLQWLHGREAHEPEDT